MGEQARLILFARAPRIGQGKRRLAADIGDVAAWAFYRHLLDGTVRRLSADPRWRTEIWLAGRDDFYCAHGSNVLIEHQQGADLGARMGHALCAKGPGPAVLIGSDIPGIARADIASAFGRLHTHEAVFGPSVDGGYWLVGMGGPRFRRERLATSAFGDVRWSSEHALADTLRGLTGARIAFISEKNDVDTGADLKRKPLGEA